jgi:Fe-S-cluster-containing hydrogenase component 2
MREGAITLRSASRILRAIGTSVRSGRGSPVRGHVEIDGNRCLGCGLCVPVCPSGALALDASPSGTGRGSVRFLGGDCRADELCVHACPEPGALRVLRIAEATLAQG